MGDPGQRVAVPARAGLDEIVVLGAAEHNLKGVDLRVPRDSLVVFTGLSGSGKSSLAFDTIYQEGQRRFMESLSAYARQFLGRMEKPRVDHVEGLSPTISIDQKTVNRNPRSTVGTVTEILDHLRLLLARLGTPRCPICGTVITALSPAQITDRLLAQHPGARLVVLAPLVRDRKGEYRKELDELRRDGWVRARIDGQIRALDEPITLARYEKHTLELVMDRLRAVPEERGRLLESVERALQRGGGMLTALVEPPEGPATESTWSSDRACPHHPEVSVPELEPRLFSFNAPQGACPQCKGLGELVRFDPERLVDPALPLPDAVLAFGEEGRLPFSWVSREVVQQVAEHLGARPGTPWRDLPAAVQRGVLLGEGPALEIRYSVDRGARQDERTRRWQGLLHPIEEVWHYTHHKGLERFRAHQDCPGCQGARLNPVALAVRFRDRGLQELTRLTLAEARAFFEGVQLEGAEREVGQELLREITARLRFLDQVGLGYLSLSRGAATLSGGEAQRIRLAAQVGSGLQGVTYVLDEPSIGLHPRDNRRLLDTLITLRDQGNTLLVVEHDRETMEAADWIVDVGPGAGREGGRVVAQGPLEVVRAADSPTARYLRGEARIEVPSVRRPGTGKVLRVEGVNLHNVRGLSVDIPLGRLVAVTGVSGSGKSTLVVQVLQHALAQALNGAEQGAPHGSLQGLAGLEHLDKVVVIDQSPIGRTPRSNPATYTGLFDEIRALFANLPDSRARGWKPGRFSFNVAGGRCEECGGAGVRTVEMQFLADVEVVCEACAGQRFNPETLEVHYRGLTITDVLNLTIAEAAEVFANHPRLRRGLQTLLSVGMGYVSLGQPSTTLSGGEAQRIKLATELQRPATGRTLYILDEPTTGLHFADVQRLLDALGRLVDAGNTVLVIEHDLDVVKVADHLIDLGPEGGDGGGRVVGEGPPERIAQLDTPTGRALAALPELGGRATSAADPARPAAARRPRPSALTVRGASCHNLKAVDLRLPLGQLSVITGVSGSGKTSLAFDTVFAEGQRRYVECMSTYARRFLGRLDRAPVESVEGLAPAIAIQQKSSSHNPRSTVGTVTEIADYLRLLWARVGQAHCPVCDAEVRALPPSPAARHLAAQASGPGWLLAPLAAAPDGEAARRDLLAQGFVRLFGPQGEVSTEDAPAAAALLAAEGACVVVDRIDPRSAERQRVAEAVRVAYGLGQGRAALQQRDGVLLPLNERAACPEHGPVWPDELTPRHFSFNSALGSCRRCEGTGRARGIDPALLFPRPELPLPQALDPRVQAVFNRSPKLSGHLAAALHALRVGERPVQRWTAPQRQGVLQGLPGRTLQARWTTRWGGATNEVVESIPWPGLLSILEGWTADLSWLRREQVCPDCGGGRLRPELLAVRLGGRSIAQLSQLTVEQASAALGALELGPSDQAVAEQPLEEVLRRLHFLQDVGLGYLTLDRAAETLSGGESQRIRLASQLGSGLVGCLYVLDEPTVGLHPRDTGRLLGTLQGLRDLGNTVLVVEHDPDTIRAADHIVDMGPGAGEGGGHIIAEGPLPALLSNPASLTGAFLSGRRPMPRNDAPRAPQGWLTLRGPRANNLRLDEARFPLGVLTAVTGVSGSGKSSLVMDALVPALQQALGLGEVEAPVAGLELPPGLKKLVVVDQAPIGTTPRSTPATFTKVMDALRELYAQAPLARARGWDRGRFSFNAEEGRCPHCEGRGSTLVEMHFLSDVWVRCEYCRGHRYNDATLEVRWQGLNIAEVLELRVQDALEHFGHHRAIARPLQRLVDVGLGYLRLGQPATELSGGECQRVKLASELGPRGQGAVFVLDEPTTGLHFADVALLIGVLHRLVEGGATVLVIEHNTDLILNADHILDLGPEGGDAGGLLLAQGRPADLIAAGTATGRALAAALRRVG